MAFNNFPYTNAHELNLDWVIKITKDILNQSETWDDNFNNLSAFVTHLQNEIDNLFTSDQWVTEVLPQIQATIDEWLEAHPEATTTVLDGAITYNKFNADVKAIWDNAPYYDNITVVKSREHDTDCYTMTIPATDSDGNVINLYVGHDGNRDPLEYADYNNTNVSINGNATLDVGGDYYVAGITISNGVVINNRSFEGYGNSNPVYVGIKQDRTHVDYPMDSAITAAQMLSDGCYNVFNAYFKLVSNGSLTDLSDVYWNDYTLDPDEPDILMLMGFKNDGTVIFFTNDGRNAFNTGITARQGANKLIGLGCVDVYFLDGGGSASMVYKGSKLNRNVDGFGTSVRDAHYTLNVYKSTHNGAVSDAFSYIGAQKQQIFEMIMPYVEENYYGSQAANWKYCTTVAEFVAACPFSKGYFVIASDDLIKTLTGNELDQPCYMYAIRNGRIINWFGRFGTYQYTGFGRYDVENQYSYWAYTTPTERGTVDLS